jgi:hypothetical protein
MMTVRGLARLLEQEKTVTPDEKRELEDTLSKATALLQGQFVGHPRQRMIEKTV